MLTKEERMMAEDAIHTAERTRTDRNLALVAIAVYLKGIYESMNPEVELDVSEEEVEQ